MKKKTLPSYFTICIVWFLVKTTGCFGQSPEFSIREFASGQIKKGVRSIGMGGDGATWGNYSLVYRDSNTVLVDAGNSSYSNDNNFSFTALGVVLPPFKNGLTIFALALSQYASNISTTLKSPGFGNSALPVHGDGNNQSIFAKAAMPIGKKISIGILVSYERSQFNGVADLSPLSVRYQTNWLPQDLEILLCLYMAMAITNQYLLKQQCQSVKKFLSGYLFLMNALNLMVLLIYRPYLCVTKPIGCPLVGSE